MQQGPKMPLSRDEWQRLLRTVVRVWGNRQRLLDRLPWSLRYGKWRRRTERQAQSDWRGGYVLQNEQDYFYLPSEIDTMSSHYLIRPMPYEPVVRNLCPTGGTVVDVGANFGEWALQMARAVGPGGRLIAFEPVAYLAEAARKTLRVNGQRQGEVVAKALSNKDGQAELTLNKTHTGKSGIGVADSDDETARVSVPTVTLDSFVEAENIGRLDFIKIDVEGHEAEVIEGAQSTLQRFGPAMVVEAGVDPDQNRQKIEAILQGLDYRMVGSLMPHGIAETTWQEYLEKKGPYASEFANVLFLPPDGKSS